MKNIKPQKMKTKRNSVFETNSSSVHTLVVKKPKEYAFELETEGEYCVVAHCHDYSEVGHNEPCILSTQQEKFDYMASWFACKHFYCWTYFYDYETLYNTLLEAVQIVNPQICMIKVLDEEKAMFDHETAPYNTNDCVVDEYDKNDICDFIFNDNKQLKCYFD